MSFRYFKKLFSSTEADKSVNDEPTALPDLQEDIENDCDPDTEQSKNEDINSDFSKIMMDIRDDIINHRQTTVKYQPNHNTKETYKDISQLKTSLQILQVSLQKQKISPDPNSLDQILNRLVSFSLQCRMFLK